MWPQCLQPSLGSLWLTVQEQMWCQDFQDGCPCRHFGYWNRTSFSNSESQYHSNASQQVLAQSNMVWEEMSFEEFQDGHLGYRNGTILAILNLYNTLMYPIKFLLNLTYGLGGDILWRISRWLPWQASWITEQNDFSNSESLFHCDASHQVLAQSYLWFGRRCRLKNFKIAAIEATWISEWNNFRNSEFSCCHTASH